MFTMLASLPLLAAAVATPHGMQVNVCAATVPELRIFFTRGGYDMPPEVLKLMTDVSTDGNGGLISQDVQLVNHTFKASAAQHWVDLALYTAVLFDRSDIAELLIRQGANVNARPEYPPFSTAGATMVKLGWQMEAERLHLEKPTRINIRNFEPDPPTEPMLEQAAECSHIATLKILLAHGADMYPKVEMNQNGSKSGILPSLIINHNEDSIVVLLSHGYDPCRDYPPDLFPKRPTDVALARREKTPAPLLQRLTVLSTKCPAPASVSSTH